MSFSLNLYFVYKSWMKYFHTDRLIDERLHCHSINCTAIVIKLQMVSDLIQESSVNSMKYDLSIREVTNPFHFSLAVYIYTKQNCATINKYRGTLIVQMLSSSPFFDL